MPRAPRPLQVPAPHRLRRDPEDLDRQGAEIRAARARARDRPAAAVTASRRSWPLHCRAALVAGDPGRGGSVPASRRGRGRSHPRRAQDAEGRRRIVAPVHAARRRARLSRSHALINAARRQRRPGARSRHPARRAGEDEGAGRERKRSCSRVIAEQREAERRAHRADRRRAASPRSCARWRGPSRAGTSRRPARAAARSRLRRTYRAARRRGRGAWRAATPATCTRCARASSISPISSRRSSRRGRR